MRTKVKIHKLKQYLITSHPIDRTGQYCATCLKEQPFDNELENFDKEFESLQETVLDLVCITKRGYYLYSYSPI